MAGDMRLAERLRALRKACDVKQLELAREMNIRPTRLANYEAGERTIAMDMKRRYIQALENVMRRRIENARSALQQIAETARDLGEA